MGGGCSCKYKWAGVAAAKLTPSGLPNRRLHRCSRTLLSDESVSKRLLLPLAPSRARNSPRTFFKCTDSSPLFSSRSIVQAIHSLGTEKPEIVHAELWCACLEVNSGHSSPAPELCIISICKSLAKIRSWSDPGGFFFWTRLWNLVTKTTKSNERVVPNLVANT